MLKSSEYNCNDVDKIKLWNNDQGQDIKNKWKEIEDKWVDIIHKQSGDDSIKWIDTTEHRSYQIPKEEFSVSETDFRKTKISQNVIYESDIVTDDNNVKIYLKREG